MCNLELTQVDSVDSIVGDEAHIRSRREAGPRHELSYEWTGGFPTHTCAAVDTRSIRPLRARGSALQR
jgi:hypothetical protein